MLKSVVAVLPLHRSLTTPPHSVSLLTRTLSTGISLTYERGYKNLLAEHAPTADCRENQQFRKGGLWLHFPPKTHDAPKVRLITDEVLQMPFQQPVAQTWRQQQILVRACRIGSLLT